MANISIDEARARQWILKVQNEVDRGADLFGGIEQACQTNPEEGDDIMESLYECGQLLQQSWHMMSVAFYTATDEIDAAISRMNKEVAIDGVQVL